MSGLLFEHLLIIPRADASAASIPEPIRTLETGPLSAGEATVRLAKDIGEVLEHMRLARKAYVEALQAYEALNVHTIQDQRRNFEAGFIKGLDPMIAAPQAVLLTLGDQVSASEVKAIQTLMDTVNQAAESIESTRLEKVIEKLADVILPDPITDARADLALDNLRLRDRFAEEERLLSSNEVGTLAGGKTVNPYATAARWKKQRKVFAVHHRGSEGYPAFQFRDGSPHPSIGLVLEVLPSAMSPWETAFWFVSANGWLDGDEPKDRLDDPDALLKAARYEGEELVG